MKTMSKIKSVLSVSLLTLAVGGLLAFWSAFSRDVSLGIEVTSSGEPIAGKASVSTLQKTYEAWAEGYKGTDPAGPVVTVMWNRGLSSEYSPAKGIAQLDLAQNKISVRITGLFDTNISDVWLVDNQPGGNRSILPEKGDKMVKLGSLNFEKNGSAWLDAGIDLLSEFGLDMVVVARHDQEPGRQGVLFGTVSLFQKLYHYPDQRHASQEVAKTKGFDLLIPRVHAQGLTPPGFYGDLDADLVNKGRELFFNETFAGNGRTCGTCHHEEDNMALGLKTIANLPDDDPLFIVEQQFRADGAPNPLFNEFRMERPELMRRLGLILENLDGFVEPGGDFTTRGVLRAPPHILSTRTTLAPPPALSDDGTLPVSPDDLVFADRTGWSGDGTPTGFREDFFESNGRELTGSLRDFAVGAVMQHFTKTLERSAFDTDEEGSPREPDFRFPTEEELDALEAFALSLGRQEENPDLNTIKLTDVVADRGRLNYLGFNVFDAAPNDGRPPLNCNACHFNGGANTNPEFPFPLAVTPNHDIDDLDVNGGSIQSHNRSFGPGVERLLDQPGDVVVQVVDAPSIAGDCFDLGLGAVPLLPGDVPGVPSLGCSANRFDNGFAFGPFDELADQRIARDRFNAPTVFEAIDTPPFFHAHQIDTVEGAVAFYATNRHLRNGDFLGAIVPLNGSQVTNVARFLRVMGADFNAESAITLLNKATMFKSWDVKARRINVSLALHEVEDAIGLLEPVSLHLGDALPLFKKARKVLSHQGLHNPSKLWELIGLLEDAQDAMIFRELM